MYTHTYYVRPYHHTAFGEVKPRSKIDRSFTLSERRLSTSDDDATRATTNRGHDDEGVERGVQRGGETGAECGG